MELRAIYQRFHRTVIDYNVFDTNSTDQSIIRIQRWSTRLYILVLWLAMMVLIIYTTLHVSSNQIEIENLSLSTYLNVYAQHKNLKCPCTQISSLYKNFVQLSPSYNQICSSQFISETWIQFLFDNNQTTSRYAADFRATATHQYQTLQKLCQLSMSAVENGLEILYSSQLISGYLLSKDLFEARLEADIAAFQRITAANFWREFTLVRSLIFGNQLMPAIETAFTIIVRSDTPGVIRSEPGLNTNLFRQSNDSECVCSDYASCHMSAGFYDIVTFDTSRGIFDQVAIPSQESISGWYTGCWPSETLLLSNLEYLYNQTEFNRIVHYVNASITDNLFNVLNISQNSTFTFNSTVEMLTKELFVEMWTKELNYTSYFAQCQPQICVYDINERASFLYIITSLLGLYGGLSVALLFITPYVVTFLMKKCRRQRQQQQENPVVEQPNTPNLTQSFRTSMSKLTTLVVNLNLFKSSKRTTATDQKHQRWSTRLYILLLTLAVLFLTLYTWLTVDSKIIQIKNPSLNTVEPLQFSAPSLQCPCTELSISYEDLIQLVPTYHQICSSEFITSTWIEGLGEIAFLSAASLYYADFRFSSPIFQLLKSMCDLANETVINALFVFGQTQLVSQDLLRPELFSEQLESDISQFKLTTPDALLHLLQLTRNITYMNQFLSGSYANFYVNYEIVQEYVHSNMTLGIYGSTSVLPNGTVYACSCANDIECGRQAALYTGPSGHRKLIYTVPGFYSRCFPVESLLPSTLECFYDNQPCLDIMANVTNETFFTSITRLNSSRPSRFMINTTINELLSELFIESWSSTLFYSIYFDKCRPQFCSYTVNTQKNELETVTIVTGLIGGLSVALRLIIPQTILLYVKFFRRRPPAPEQPNENILQTTTIRRKALEFITTLNMFEKTHRTVLNEHEIYLQRQSTRVYLLLLLFVLFILVIYTSLIYQQNNNVIKISTPEQFQYVQNLHGFKTIECPCTKISFARGTFFQIEPIFHQICSSDFIDMKWLNSLFATYEKLDPSEINSYTFNGTAFAYFQSLRLLCNLAKQAVIDAQNLFLTKPVVSANMLGYDLFGGQTNASLTFYKATLSNSFVHTLDMLRDMAQGNGLVSAYSTNWGVFLPNMTKDATVYTKARIYNQCNCATSAACIQSSIPYVPGFVVGCLPLESLLRSTFECFYNQSCVNAIASYVNATNIPRALNASQSRFAPKLITNNIVEEMFIESLSINISYEKFFEQCQPTSCSYTLIGRYNVLYVVTTIVGLYGGLTVLLKLIVPFGVYQIHTCIRRRRHANIQIAPMNEHY